MRSQRSVENRPLLRSLIKGGNRVCYKQVAPMELAASLKTIRSSGALKVLKMFFCN
ncbi:MAG: hypothetical protein JWO44_462 [Bacteroidetes bacterium]|nr:hypothetical protein [Bacteroidota bacterium]